MMMYQRVLCAIDLDDLKSSRLVLQRARELARLGQLTMMLLNVLRPLPINYVEFLPADFDASELRAAKERLVHLLKDTGDLPASYTCTVRRGTPYVEILNEAAAVEADLIIIGSHQPTFASKLLGSNAASIARHARVDVLIARDPGSNCSAK
jgi:nucleotide-binding universal stress UspA family protein